MIQVANIDNAGLETLVLQHRDKAGRADNLHSKPEHAAHYRDVQNGWVDIYQELLDRRRAAKPTTQH
jgi:hypothetical protein